VNPALSDSGLARVREFVGSRSLLAFDIDGTLAPIVARPWDARIPDEVQRRLAALTTNRSVAIITGRAIADAKPMLAFTPRYLIGNHGAEGVPGFEVSSAAYARECTQWLEELRDDREPWGAMSGITLEDKAYSIAFHYRHALSREGALRLVEDRAAQLVPRPRVVHGNCVLNVVSQGAPHKGDALRALMAHSGCEISLYVGDDLTDEDVFRLRLPAVLSVGIDPKPDSAADLFLSDQGQIITLLDEVARMIVD
jgi:trehalose 6-phosphate phosphatase